MKVKLDLNEMPTCYIQGFFVLVIFFKKKQTKKNNQKIKKSAVSLIL